MSDDRRHPPTARRRAEALRSGRVPHSLLLTRALVATLAAAALWASAATLGEGARWMVRSALEPGGGAVRFGAPDAPGFSRQAVLAQIGPQLRLFAAGMAGVAALCLVMYVLAHGVQTGFRLRRSRQWAGTLAARFRTNVGQLPGGLAYAGVMAISVWWGFPAGNASPAALLSWLGRVVAAAMAVWCVLGIVDYLLAWRRFEASLRMSTAELKEELRRERSARRPVGSVHAGPADGVRSV